MMGLIRTQSDLAKIVGYSRVTVSKALAGHPGVLPQTREAIVRAAQEAGYRPNAAARSMRRGQFGCIGLLLGQHAGPLCRGLRGLIDGISAQLRAEHLMLNVDLLPEPGVSIEHWPRMLTETAVDGCLLACQRAYPQETLDRITGLGIPLIWLGTRREARDCVYPDEKLAGQRATAQLIKRGHRRIAFIGRPALSEFDDERLLLAGYESAMREAALEPMKIESREKGIGMAGPLTELTHRLDRADRPTALVVGGQEHLACVLRIAAGAKLRVPEDLGIAVISATEPGSAGCEVDWVTIDWAQIGRLGVHMLREKIDHPERSIRAVAGGVGPVHEGLESIAGA